MKFVAILFLLVSSSLSSAQLPEIKNYSDVKITIHQLEKILNVARATDLNIYEGRIVDSRSTTMSSTFCTFAFNGDVEPLLQAGVKYSAQLTDTPTSGLSQRLLASFPMTKEKHPSLVIGCTKNLGRLNLADIIAALGDIATLEISKQ